MRKLRQFLIGKDDARYFDVRQYANFRMADRTVSDRLAYRWIDPIVSRIANWKGGWDLRFRLRYKDRWLGKQAR